MARVKDSYRRRAQVEKQKPNSKVLAKPSPKRKVASVKPPTNSASPHIVSEPSEVQKVQTLLAQVWHRNKNQHRTQKWWKWLGILRRGVRDLVGLEDGQRKDEAGILGGFIGARAVRKRMQREKGRNEEIKRLEEWVREVVLGNCWRAFSTVVADDAFSTLGVVLLSILARIGKLVGFPEPVPEFKAGPKPRTFLAASLRQTGDDRGQVVERPFESEDVGELVRRGDRIKLMAGRDRDRSEVFVAREVVRGAEVSEESPLDREVSRDDEAGKDEMLATTATISTGTIQHKKKRLKKGNAIDDLFEGLE